ncbi:MAG: LysM peptidoglycan-binding domain-containing protein [Ignavibacteriales bacterium]
MNQKLRVYGLLVSVFLSFLFSYQSIAATYSMVDVTLNNNSINWDTKPINVDGSVYMPIAEIIQAAGMQGAFDAKTLVYSIKFEQNEIELKLDNSIASINGKLIQMTGPMKIINTRLMMPVKNLEKLGFMVVDRSGKVLVFKPENGKIIYKVASGDYLWKVSQMFGTPISEIKILNNLTSDNINIGQMLVVKIAEPFSTNYDAVTGSATIKSGAGFGFSDVGYLAAGTHVSVTGKSGLWYKVSTLKGNGYIYYTVIKVTQSITDTTVVSTFFQKSISVDTSGDTISYKQYKVMSGDILWSIAEKMGIPVEELAKVNGLSTSSYLTINQVLIIPVHTIIKKQTVNAQAGEVLDWFTEGQYVLPIGKIAKVTDVQTGLSFNIQRTIGSSHSDTETLTAGDTQIMKNIFGGTWNWTRRAFILEADGRKFAVSIAGMPHAGVEGQPFLQNVYNRSDNYGYGPNYDRISGNQMDGHFDLYFLNGLKHLDNQIDPDHQKMVMIAGGLK